MENLYHAQRKRDKGVDDNKEKREIHKEIERQRRKEMASLYASLRSQLPLEYIKGKRSISDHMHEAVNYIKYLQKNVKDLEIKREEMKRISNSSALSHTSQCSTNKLENFLSVNVCKDNSLEILINRGLREKGVMLSRVFEVLLEEGVDILTYTSTTTDDMVLHIIKTEVCKTSAIDLTMLQGFLCETQLCLEPIAYNQLFR